MDTEERLGEMISLHIFIVTKGAFTQGLTFSIKGHQQWWFFVLLLCVAINLANDALGEGIIQKSCIGGPVRPTVFQATVAEERTVIAKDQSFRTGSDVVDFLPVCSFNQLHRITVKTTIELHPNHKL
ncbi:MAG: hypothetical protein EOO04_06530 [Chitinophagaceae bacterium]|nr:MAG: hypothetical protein EOO04_06530 [Chitinophagaceae bacterium]